jgi:hypothetical protein
MSFPPHDSKHFEFRMADGDVVLILLSLSSVSLSKGRREGYCFLERNRRVSD